MKAEFFDVIIVGAGPAGCSCALNLASTGLRIAVVDKAVFPRDKVCGGALGDRSMNCLNRMPGKFIETFLNFPETTPMNGIRLYAPNSKFYDLVPKQSNDFAASYILKRSDFDNLLYSELSKYDNISVFTQKVKDLIINDKKISLQCFEITLEGSVVVGCDGANSIVANKSGLRFDSASASGNRAKDKDKDKDKDKEHLHTGIRTYFTNVSNSMRPDLAELHYIKDILPGYFWIFPLNDNLFNVGIGASQKTISRKKINLRYLMFDLIENDPHIAPRFRQAEQVGKIQAHVLPFATKKRMLSGSRVILAGDAASLIDPLMGEGIGNALLSGEIAAKHIINCFEKDDLSAGAMLNYDKMIYERLWSELKVNTRLSKFFVRPFYYNYLINKANNNKHFQALISEMLDNNLAKRKLFNPLLYLRILF